MTGCLQTHGMTILQHGESVAEYYKDLTGPRLKEWRLPEWFISHREMLLDLCPDPDLMEMYHIYHDCGKPYCLKIDEEGRRHFPNHAAVSASIWRVHGGDERVAQLIQHDMDMHLLKPAEVDSYSNMHLAAPLLLTALAELHSNAVMFGGLESTSFKIKFKNLNRLGKAFIARIIKEQS